MFDVVKPHGSLPYKHTWRLDSYINPYFSEYALFTQNKSDSKCILWLLSDDNVFVYADSRCGFAFGIISLSSEWNMSGSHFSPKETDCFAKPIFRTLKSQSQRFHSTLLIMCPDLLLI